MRIISYGESYMYTYTYVCVYIYICVCMRTHTRIPVLRGLEHNKNDCNLDNFKIVIFINVIVKVGIL